MEQIKKDIKSERTLLDKFGADERYNQPDSYSYEESFHGDGKYPPDWGERRRIIWWLQDDKCGRCGRRQRKKGQVHHIKHLSEGGSNDLNNLVGLCTDCHALMHPEVDDIPGNWKTAPKYPAKNAVNEVSVIRRGRSGTFEEEFRAESDFQKLVEETNVKENNYAAQSSAVYETAPSVARQFSTDKDLDSAEKEIQATKELNRLLLLRDRVPENELYNNRRLSLKTSQNGILGWLSPFEPEITVKPERPSESESRYNAIAEEVNGDDTDHKEFIFSKDVNEATVTVTEGDGGVTHKSVSFSDRNNEQSFSVSVSPPPLSTSTLGSYIFSAGMKTYIFPLIFMILYILFMIILFSVVVVTGIVLALSLFVTIFGAIGTVFWFFVALLFDGSWTEVGAMAGVTIISFVVATIAAAILELFGIDLGE